MTVSENNKNLYAHYLTVPSKARQAAQLLEQFPELGNKPKEEPMKEVKPFGKKPKG